MKPRWRRNAALLIVVLGGLSVASYVALRRGASADERFVRALALPPGYAETAIVRELGPPTVRRPVQPGSKDVCSSTSNPPATWALEYHLPQSGVGSWIRKVAGPSSIVSLCMDASNRLVMTSLGRY